MKKNMLYSLVLVFGILSILWTSASANGTPSKIPVIELYAHVDSPLECRGLDQWHTGRDVSLMASHFRKGFDTAHVVVLIGVDDGQRIHRTDVAFLDKNQGSVTVVNPCDQSHLVTVELSILSNDLVRVTSSTAPNAYRMIRTRDRLDTSEGFSLVFFGVVPRDDFLAFQVIP